MAPKTTKPKGEKAKKVKAPPAEAPAPVAPVEEATAPAAKEAKTDRFFEAIGRRKTAHARVRVYTKGAGITVNEKEYTKYFPLLSLQQIVDAPLRKMKSAERFRVSARVWGGGIHAQAEAVRHGMARALVVFNADFRKRLKRAGYLRRDSRMKEAKKFGLKKARKAPRWSKR